MDALQDAIYRTVHDGHPRGAVGLAPLIGMKSGTLNNKADPAHDSELTLRESIPLMRETRDYQILATLAAAVDHAVIPLGDFSGTSDSELLDLYAKYHSKVGKAAGEVSKALADGRITQSEVRQVRQAFIRAARANLAFVARLEAIAEPEAFDE